MEYVRKGSTIILRLERGEEVVSALKELQKKEKVLSASFSGIGATDNATIGVYNTAEKRYEATQLTGDMEIAALNGNLSRTKDGEPYIHAHAVLGRGREAHAGHLNAAIISATAEIFVFVTDIAVSSSPRCGNLFCGSRSRKSSWSFYPVKGCMDMIVALN